MPVTRLQLAGVVVLSAGVGCTWGTYDGRYDASSDDGGNRNDANVKGPSTLIESGLGGLVTSDDGLFTVAFPPGSLNTGTRASISRNLDASGLPQFCVTNNAVTCRSSAYTVTLTAEPGGGPTSQLVGTIGVSFDLPKSGFNVPLNEAFLVKPGPQAMPGGWTSSGEVYGFLPADSSSSVLGPFAIVHAQGTIPSGQACAGNDACDPCARACCASSSAPSNSAGIHEACMCTGPSPSTDQCLGKCVRTGSPQTCP